MRLFITLSILLAAFVVASADERVVSDFDGEKDSIARMREIIRIKAEEGATVVRFSDGQWRWHDLTSLGLPLKQKMAQRKFERAAARHDSTIRDWVTKHGVKAVVISVNNKEPANIFFEIERLLTELKLPYALAAGGEVEPGNFLLQETNGRVRSIAPKEPKGEGGADQPATAPESKNGTETGAYRAGGRR